MQALWLEESHQGLIPGAGFGGAGQTGRTGPAQLREARRHLRRTLLSSAVLSLVMSGAIGPYDHAQAAIINWTGNAPLYLARWFDGSSLIQQEFQSDVEWQFYCNTHFGAVCAKPTLWGSGGNWDTFTRPTAIDDVVIPFGAMVSVERYTSIFQGFIPGIEYAASVNSLGTISIGLGSFLHTDRGFIANLQGAGTLVNNGVITIDNGGAIFQGTGTTVINNLAALSYGGTAQGGHTISYQGPTVDVSGVSLSDQSRFINTTSLGQGTVQGFGSFNPNTQSTFINRGTLSGAWRIDGARFNNDGIFILGAGNLDALSNGTHTGSFNASAGTRMSFGALGASGHTFTSSSSILSAGEVRFSGSTHRVAGNYRAADTVVFGDVVLTGNVGFLNRVTAAARGSSASFETAAGVAMGDLFINGGLVSFDAGAVSSANTVALSSGGLVAHSGLVISGRLNWDAGTVAGRGSVQVNGGIEMGAGTRSLDGTLHNNGTTNWNAGNFDNWTGTFNNLAGATFDLKSDFNVAGGGGRFNNGGVFIKSGGAGTSALAVAFDNQGLVDVRSGRLQLSGGGSHRSVFSAAPGAVIELSGGHTAAGVVVTTGRVDLSSGSFTVLAGGTYRNASGNQMTGTDFTNRAAGRFSNDGLVTWSGTVSNQGSLENRSYFQSQNLVNGGTITSSVGTYLYAFGSVINMDTGRLDNAGTAITRGFFNNSGDLRNVGSFSMEGLSNEESGSVSNLALAQMSVLLNSSNAGDINNAGRLTTDGNFHNAALGSIVNSGEWTNAGLLRNEGGIENSGLIDNNGGELLVLGGARIFGPGRYLQSGGITNVSGTLEAGAGIYIDNGILKGGGTILGNVTLGAFGRWQPANSPGTMTVVGDVTVDTGSLFAPSGLEIEIASGTLHDKLIVNGAFTFASDSKVGFVFLPGFAPNDGDDFEWLRANAVFNNGVLTSVTGLPAAWSSSVMLAGGAGRIELSYDLATQIATSGAVRIAAGAFRMNSDPGGAFLLSLDNAGSFSNRSAYATIRDLNNQAGAYFSNKGNVAVYDSLQNAGTLRNRVGGELTVGTPAFLQAFDNTGLVRNEGTINSGARLSNARGGRIENVGVFNNQGGQIVNQGEFVVSGLINNTGHAAGQAAIVNTSGTFDVKQGGLVTGTGRYLQDIGATGTTRVNGSLVAPDITLLGGTLAGSGRLAGQVTLGDALVRSGNSPGVLTIDGQLTAGGTTFIVELAGPADFDQLVVTGDASFTFSNTLTFQLLGHYVPAFGDGFTWLSVGGATSGLGSFTWSIEKADGAGGFYTWANASFAPAGIQIAFNGTGIGFSAAPVPEPQTWVLWLAGLGMGAWQWRRRGVAAAGA